MRNFILITCEHGGNRVPAPYRKYFRNAPSALASHRGYDPGALVMARAMAKAFAAPLMFSTVSRLVVDLNRSRGHARLHAECIRDAGIEVRNRILDTYYCPYRARVERIVEEAIAAGRRVVHISSHSFTPLLAGKRRRADVGLLYDPAREGEVALCREWKQALDSAYPRLTVRRNYPYAGKGDGLTRHLRNQYPASTYIGIELELNQKHTRHTPSRWQWLRSAVLQAFQVGLERT